MRNILVKKNSHGKKKREKIVIRSDKISSNELHVKRSTMDGISKMRNDREINVLFLDC